MNSSPFAASASPAGPIEENVTQASPANLASVGLMPSSRPDLPSRSPVAATTITDRACTA